MLVAVTVLIFSAVKLIGYFGESYAAERVTDTMIQSGVGIPGESPVTDGTDGHQVPIVPLDVDFEMLCAQYPDLIGWLYCPETPINYPIMYSGDNDYYLRRLPDGTYNENGSLFLDYQNETDFSSPHSIIYGHNMKNDAMLGSLENYQKQAYYEEHPVIYLLTPEADYEIRLLGAYTAAPDSDSYCMPEDTDGIADLVSMAVANSFFTSSDRPTGEEPVITLSTCTYNRDNDRFVVVGYLYQISE